MWTKEAKTKNKLVMETTSVSFYIHENMFMILRACSELISPPKVGVIAETADFVIVTL